MPADSLESLVGENNILQYLYLIFSPDLFYL